MSRYLSEPSIICRLSGRTTSFGLSRCPIHNSLGRSESHPIPHFLASPPAPPPTRSHDARVRHEQTPLQDWAASARRRNWNSRLLQHVRRQRASRVARCARRPLAALRPETACATGGEAGLGRAPSPTHPSVGPTSTMEATGSTRRDRSRALSGPRGSMGVGCGTGFPASGQSTVMFRAAP